MKKKDKKRYALISLFVLVVVAGVLGYYYHNRQKEEKAAKKLNTLSRETAKTNDGEQEQKRLAEKYVELYKKYPSTKAGRTACFKAGGIYHELQHYDKAIKMLASCPPFTEKETATFECIRQKMLGQAYKHQKKYKKSIACYTKATEKDFGQQAVYLDELADIHKAIYDEKKDIKHLKEAIKALKKACDAHPDHDCIGDFIKKQEQFKIDLKRISKN